MVHGQNPASLLLLKLLNLTPGDFGRFRDVRLAQNDDAFEIVVHTRCGGGNRESYQEVFESMREHPAYLGNEDDDYDCTYCDFISRHLPS